ncbi:MAG: DUF975 domain-containing protein [Cyanobacteriota bacterium]|nr:DUF975 domain-containing protein [Cyanobacteriota bacterium]
MTQTPLQPLSVGNAVSAAFRLYRDRFKSYLIIAIRANLWLLLPLVVILPIPFLFLLEPVNTSLVGLLALAAIPLGFVGLAKYQANLALISRLVFGILTNKPETVEEASRQVLPKVWKFLRASLLVGAIIVGIYIAFALCIGLLSVALGGLVSGAGDGSGIGIAIIFILLITVATICGIVFLIRFIMRFSIMEVPLAIEDINAVTTVRRSWNLTQKNIGRIFAIFLVAGLITFPLQAIASVLSNVIQAILNQIIDIENTSPAFLWISVIISYILGLILSVFFVPFWQAIKAAIYYDLRSRKEGIDLRLRDRAL